MISTDQEKVVSLGPGAIEVMQNERTAGRRADNYDFDRYGRLRDGCAGRGRREV